VVYLALFGAGGGILGVEPELLGTSKSDKWISLVHSSDLALSVFFLFTGLIVS
jgi:hypothetical protein